MCVCIYLYLFILIIHVVYKEPVWKTANLFNQAHTQENEKVNQTTYDATFTLKNTIVNTV